MKKISTLLLLCSMLGMSNNPALYAMQGGAEDSQRKVDEKSHTVEQLAAIVTACMVGQNQHQARVAKEAAAAQRRAAIEAWNQTPIWKKANFYVTEVSFFIWKLPDHAWKNKMTVVKVLVLIGALKHMGISAYYIDCLYGLMTTFAGATLHHLFDMSLEGLETLVGHAVKELCTHSPTCARMLLS